MAGKVLAEVGRIRRGYVPSLDHWGTRTEWQQLLRIRPGVWTASTAPLYESRCGGRGRGKRLQKLTVSRPALWYAFLIMFVFLVGPIHHFTSVFCCRGSSEIFNALAAEVWPLQPWESSCFNSGRSARAETETHSSIYFCSLHFFPLLCLNLKYTKLLYLLSCSIIVLFSDFNS